MTLYDSPLANESDPENDALTPSIVTDPSHGVASFDFYGNLSYVPTPGYVGSDSLTYRVFDGTNYSNTVTINIDVTNTAPVAVTDSYSTHHDVPLYVSPMTNDSDADSDVVTPSIVDGPTHGVANFDFYGNLQYVPTAGYVGSDSLTYRIFDGAEYSDPVTINISLTNTAPVAITDSYSTHHDVPLYVSPMTNDNDADSDVLTPSIVDGPTHGIAYFDFYGNLQYVPTAGYVGSDSLTYRVFDGAEYSDPVTINFSVTNTVPVIGSLLFDSASPMTNDILTVQIIDPLDEDNDPISFTYVWSVNGIIVQTTNTSILTDSLDLSQPGFGGKDDVISVAVAPSDIIQIGAPVTAGVTVGSIAPSISFVLPTGFVTNPDLADGPEESPYADITFQIDGLGGNGEIPTGTVTFAAIDPFNGVSTLGIAMVGSDGRATLQVLKTQLDHTGLLIQADYSGDDNFTAISGNDGNGSVNEDGVPDPAVIGNPSEIPADASNLTVVVVCGSGAERQAYMHQARTRYGAGAYLTTSVHSIQDLGRHLASFPVRSISRLVIIGHGSYDINHELYDGDPARGLRMGRDNASRFNAQNLSQGPGNAAALQQLHNAMAQNALIVLNACNLAETAAHRNHLIAIAHVIAVPGLRIRARAQYVTGCPDSDLPDTGWHTRSTADANE